ncbi:MAG: diguanylate cyclase [Candidatus Acidiferrum sp.]|jgi:diguanylate cyclase (GGDEF)-like protein
MATAGPSLLVPPKRICILLAGDCSGKAAQCFRALFAAPEHLLELTVVSTVATLLATLSVVHPEVIVLDLDLAHASPQDTIRRVHRAAPNIPLVVLADEVRKEDAKHALSEGVIDYILREFMDAATLTRIFRGAMQRNTFEGLADLLRDQVTGLYTRDGFLTVGSSTLYNARRNEGTLALFCVLVQNLSTLREKYGNGVADNLLQELTATLTDCFRRSDTLARIGDAQFAVLAVDSTESGAAIVRQRLGRRLATLLQGSEYPATVRFSVTGEMWDSAATPVFSEFLDSVESGLRVGSGGSLVPA